MLRPISARSNQVSMSGTGFQPVLERSMSRSNACHSEERSDEESAFCFVAPAF